MQFLAVEGEGFFESELWNTVRTWLATTGLNILIALAIVAVGLVAAHVLAKSITKLFGKTHIDASLVAFIATAVRILIAVLAVITALGQLGVPTTSIITAFASCAVAIGLAMQSSLSNIAGGMFLLITRPLSTGEIVEVDGTMGRVKKIDIVSTVIVTYDNNQIIIPNGQLINKTITNYSREARRRLSFTVSVAYTADVMYAKEVIVGALLKNPMVLSDPAPTVAVIEHGSSGIVFTVKPWCKTEDYWPLKYQIGEQLKLALDEAGIEIPYNKLDVYIKEK